MYTKGQYVHEKMLTVFQCEEMKTKAIIPKTPITSTEWLESKDRWITSVDEDLGKVKTLYTKHSGNIKCQCHFGKTLTVP